MIEDFKKFSKTLMLKATLVATKDLEEFLLIYAKNLHKIEKIPQIIDLDKDYKEFYIENKPKSEKRLVFVTEDNTLCKIDIKLVLTYDYFTYKEILREILPEEIEIPGSYQIIGSILHVNLEKEQLNYKNLIGEVLLDKTKNIKTVITKVGIIDTVYRHFETEILAGENSLLTYHYEAGIKFYIDYQRVYWNSKLQDERNTLLKKIKKEETICDPFCGVGPLVVRAAKKGCKVYCNDLNPVAIECLQKNLKINKIKEGNVIYQNKDVEDYLKELSSETKSISHFVYNLPERSLEFLKCLKEFLPGSTVHCYFFCKSDINPEDLVLKYCNPNMEYCSIKLCRNVAPNKRRYLLTGTIGHLNII